HIFGFSDAAKTFAPETAVNPATGVITLKGHGFKTGDAVVYQTDPTRQSQQPAWRESSFAAADAVVIDATGQTDAGDPVVDPAAGTIALPVGTRLVTGERVTYRPRGGAPIGGLDDGKDYYVIEADSGRIKLADTQAHALAKTALPLGAGATGTAHRLEP